MSLVRVGVRHLADRRDLVRHGAIVFTCVLVAGVIALLPPVTALWIIFAALMLVFAVVRPSMLCYALVPAVALDTVFSLRIGSLRAGPTDVLAAALALSWTLRAVTDALSLSLIVHATPAIHRPAGFWRSLLRVLRVRYLSESWKRHREKSALIIALAVYLGIILLSASVAPSRADVVKEGLKWAEVLVVFAVASQALDSTSRRTVATWTMVGVGVAEALVGYVQWILATGELGVGGATVRAYGTFDQPNPYAAYLNLALPIALALALWGTRAAHRWVAAGCVALMLGGEYLAGSRGGDLGLAASLVVVIVVGYGIVRLALAVGVGAAAVGLIAWFLGAVPRSLQQRVLGAVRLDAVTLTGPLNDANFSSVERLAHWVAGLRMFQSHPWLGVGAGNYAAAYARYAVPGWPLALGHAHNYYINAAAETGILGLLAFVAVAGTMVYIAIRAAHGSPAASPEQRDDNAVDATPSNERGRTQRSRWWAMSGPQTDVSRALAVGVLGVVAAVLVHSFVDDLFVHGMELQIALCVALTAGIVEARRQPQQVPERGPDVLC